MKQLTGVLKIEDNKYSQIENIIKDRNKYYGDYMILEDVIYLDENYACTFNVMFDEMLSSIKTIIIIHYGDKDIKTEIFYDEFHSKYLIKLKENIEVLINIKVI